MTSAPPRELDRLIVAAREGVRRDPGHDLRLGLRHAIWAQLDDPAGSKTKIGQRRRGRLALLCVEHVQDRWLQARPGDELVTRVLDLAEDALRDPSFSVPPRLDPGDLHVQVDDVAASSDGDGWVLAGYAAVAAFAAVLRDESFDPKDIDEDAVDTVRDPYTFDAAFLAAGACARGLPGDPGADSAARARFWEWWLGEAVPTAWASEG